MAGDRRLATGDWQAAQIPYTLHSGLAGDVEGLSGPLFVDSLALLVLSCHQAVLMCALECVNWQGDSSPTAPYISLATLELAKLCLSN